MAQIIIRPHNNGPEKIIETDKPFDEVIVSGSIIPFFHSLEPRHTGSGEYSGSIETEYDEETGEVVAQYFVGENYGFENF